MYCTIDSRPFLHFYHIGHLIYLQNFRNAVPYGEDILQMRARSFVDDKTFASEWLMSAAECLPLPKPRGEHKARLAGAPGTDRQKRPRL